MRPSKRLSSGAKRGAVRLLAIAVGAILVLCGAAVFAVRFGHAGPYVFPWSFDLPAALVNLLLGLLLVRLGSSPSGGRRSLALAVSLALAPIVFAVGFIATTHEIGEVVVLRTFDAGGGSLDTRLWVLDHEGATWVGTGARKRHAPRLVANPRVELVRGGGTECRVAVVVDDPDVRRKVFRHLEEKYLLGRLLSALGFHLFLDNFDTGAVLAIRLDPC